MPSVGGDAITCSIVQENVEKPKERILPGKMLLNFDHLLDHFNWDLDNKKTNKIKPASNLTFTAKKLKSKVKTKQKKNQENRRDSDEVDYQTDDFETDVEQFQFTLGQLSILLKKREGRDSSSQEIREENKKKGTTIKV